MKHAVAAGTVSGRLTATNCRVGRDSDLPPPSEAGRDRLMRCVEKMGDPVCGWVDLGYPACLATLELRHADKGSCAEEEESGGFGDWIAVNRSDGDGAGCQRLEGGPLIACVEGSCEKGGSGNSAGVKKRDLKFGVSKGTVGDPLLRRCILKEVAKEVEDEEYSGHVGFDGEAVAVAEAGGIDRNGRSGEDD